MREETGRGRRRAAEGGGQAAAGASSSLRAAEQVGKLSLHFPEVNLQP